MTLKFFIVESRSVCVCGVLCFRLRRTLILQNTHTRICHAAFLCVFSVPSRPVPRSCLTFTPPSLHTLHTLHIIHITVCFQGTALATTTDTHKRNHHLHQHTPSLLRTYLSLSLSGFVFVDNDINPAPSSSSLPACRSVFTLELCVLSIFPTSREEWFYSPSPPDDVFKVPPPNVLEFLSRVSLRRLIYL